MKFTKSHEWAEVNGSVATIGVSQHAQKELGEIVYVELPEVGKEIQAGEEGAVLESTKAAADVYSPLSGRVVEVNQTLQATADLINSSPEKEGWIFKIQLSNPSEWDNLMSRDSYLNTLKG